MDFGDKMKKQKPMRKIMRQSGHGKYTKKQIKESLDRISKKVSHRKPKGYYFDMTFQSKPSAQSMTDGLNLLGYDTKIIEEDNVYYLYKKKR